MGAVSVYISYLEVHIKVSSTCPCPVGEFETPACAEVSDVRSTIAIWTARPLLKGFATVNFIYATLLSWYQEGLSYKCLF